MPEIDWKEVLVKAAVGGAQAAVGTFAMTISGIVPTGEFGAFKAAVVFGAVTAVVRGLAVFFAEIDKSVNPQKTTAVSAKKKRFLDYM